MAGYVYVIHDGVTGLSKIGCAKSNGKRQRSVMASHGHVLANVLNIEVEGHYAVEAQCHRHFASTREGGEWFSAKVEDIIEYVHTNTDWVRMEFLDSARFMTYLLACRTGNTELARKATTP